MTDNINKISDDLIKNYKTKKFKDALVQADILTKHKIKNKQINFICGELFLSFRLYKKALFSLAYSIKLDPNFYMAYKLLGITEYSLGNFNKALKIYNAAKKLNNLDADLFFNIAKSYSDLGKYDLSIKNYIKSLKLDPNNKETKINLIKSLTFFKPKDHLGNEIIKLDLSLYNLILHFSFNKILDNRTLKTYLKKNFDIIKTKIDNLDFDTTQIFRNNHDPLDCPRYHTAFNTYNIIPKNCFSCFKVQVNVFNVVDLIKLHFLFDNITFVKNIKKCMVEKRKDIDGNYKGFIYCKTVDEAETLKVQIEQLINKSLKIDHKTIVKRGCSEFTLKYPDYKITDSKSKSFFKYNDEWQKKENIINEFYPKNISSELNPHDTLKGNSLNDMITIKNWINYAESINDYSFKKLT